MSRTLIDGNYDGKGNYQLRFAEGDRAGEVYQTIAPNAVISVGNSIGGWWAKPIRYAGQPMLALVRVGGGQKSLPAEELRRRFGQERGFVLVPNMRGLWATSSGSARRGLCHRVGVESDPVKNALREVRMPSHLISEVASIDVEVSRGGNLCGHSTRQGNYHCYFETDGQAEVKEYGESVREHGNQFHIGCQLSPDCVRITGATWLVEAVVSKAMNGCNYPSISRVTITPAADRSIVAEKIRTMMERG